MISMYVTQSEHDAAAWKETFLLLLVVAHFITRKTWSVGWFTWKWIWWGSWNGHVTTSHVTCFHNTESCPSCSFLIISYMLSVNSSPINVCATLLHQTSSAGCLSLLFIMLKVLRIVSYFTDDTGFIVCFIVHYCHIAIWRLNPRHELSWHQVCFRVTT